jgi:hypothetical protein
MQSSWIYLRKLRGRELKVEKIKTLSKKETLYSKHGGKETETILIPKHTSP